MPPPSALLYAVEPEGPRELVVPGDRGDVHDLFDELELGIYEAQRTYDHHRLIGFPEHLQRAQRSMERLGWTRTLDRDALAGAIDTILRGSPFEESRIRYDVLAAPATRLGTRSDTLVALSPHTDLPAEFFELGVCCPLIRDLARERPLIKEAKFVIARRKHPIGDRERYEGLMVDGDGRLLELTSANFCVIRGGALHTAREGVLEGITMGMLAEIARGLGMEVVAADLFERDLEDFDEAFLSSSIRGLVPIVKVGDVPIGAGRPGPGSKALREAYERLVWERAVPASEACAAR